MKQEYRKPSLQVLGDLRDVTAASHGGFLADLIHGVISIIKPPDREGSN
jgi:hypothetical protein